MSVRSRPANPATTRRTSSSGDRPVIGITTYVEPVSWGHWAEVAAAVLPHSYVKRVEEAGAIAVLVPPRLDADEEFAHELLERLDAVILAGGADVDSARYAAQRHPSAQPPRPDRDSLELALARVSAKRGTPVLGICRGMQVMAVAAGGSLEQHIPDRVAESGHTATPGVYASHPVTMVEGTRLARILGAEIEAPSYHHQSVLAHPGYEPAAWAADGTLEAMEDPRHPFRLAVQWHPEAGSDLRLFEALAAAAAEQSTAGAARHT